MISRKLRAICSICATAALALPLSACAISFDGSDGDSAKKKAPAAIEKLTVDQAKEVVKESEFAGKKLVNATSLVHSDPDMQSMLKQTRDTIKSAKEHTKPARCFESMTTAPNDLDYVVQVKNGKNRLVQLTKSRDMNMTDRLNNALDLADECKDVQMWSARLRHTIQELDVDNAESAAWETTITEQDGNSSKELRAEATVGSVQATVLSRSPDSKEAMTAALQDILNNLAKQAK